MIRLAVKAGGSEVFKTMEKENKKDLKSCAVFTGKVGIVTLPETV